MFSSTLVLILFFLENFAEIILGFFLYASLKSWIYWFNNWPLISSNSEITSSRLLSKLNFLSLSCKPEFSFWRFKEQIWFVFISTFFQLSFTISPSSTIVAAAFCNTCLFASNFSFKRDASLLNKANLLKVSFQKHAPEISFSWLAIIELLSFSKSWSIILSYSPKISWSVL